MIQPGEIRKILTPFYDSATHQKSVKSRPALVIARADFADTVVLPISSVSRRENLHPVYDIEIDPSVYPKLNLRKVSYVRTHKQTVIHSAEISDVISSIKDEYPELYLDILQKREMFSQDVTNQALR